MSTVQSLVDPKCKERLARQEMKYEQEIDKLKKSLKELRGKSDTESSDLDEILEPKPPKKPPPALLKKPHHMQRFVYPADRENIPQSEMRQDASAREATQTQTQVGSWQKVRIQAPIEMPPLEDLSARESEESTGARNGLYWFYNRLSNFNCVFFSSAKAYWYISSGIYRSI